MYASMISSAAVLLALAPSALAVGSANVMNNCGFTVYYKSITTSSEPFQTVPAGGVHQTYATQGRGVSIKLALNNSDSAPISQFEYTWSSSSIFYDLSNINGDPNSPEGYPFAAGGMTVTPSITNDSKNPTCVPIVCPAGTLVCSAAYNSPNDPKTMVCSQDASLTLTLCPGSSKRDRQTRQIRHPHRRVWVTV
jgi:hypothetical protein